MRFSTDYGDMADRQIVVEAVIENEDEKVAVFNRLDKVVEDPDAILASNTSSIPIMKLGMATSRPAQVLGIHFFNPVPVLKLVEVIESLLTGPETRERAEQFAINRLGKTVIHSQDRAGFVVNALLIPYLLSAIRMVESGFATKEHIDEGMVLGCNHPMGPLALTDLIGLDTTMAVSAVALRGVQGAAVRGAAAAGPHGRCRPARPQDRPRLLRVRQRPLGARGSPPRRSSRCTRRR